MNIEQFYPLFLKADKVTIDSRKIAKRDLFFAFSGENFNAATLAEKAIDDGALAAIVELPEFENKEKIFSMFRLLLSFCSNWLYIIEISFPFL